MSKKELDDLNIYLMVKGAINGGTIPKGMKIGDAIKARHGYDESERLAKDKAKKAESLAKRSVIIKSMSKLVSVSLVKLDFKPEDTMFIVREGSLLSKHPSKIIQMIIFEFHSGSLYLKTRLVKL